MMGWSPLIGSLIFMEMDNSNELSTWEEKFIVKDPRSLGKVRWHPTYWLRTELEEVNSLLKEDGNTWGDCK